MGSAHQSWGRAALRWCLQDWAVASPCAFTHIGYVLSYPAALFFQCCELGWASMCSPHHCLFDLNVCELLSINVCSFWGKLRKMVLIKSNFYSNFCDLEISWYCFVHCGGQKFRGFKKCVLLAAVIPLSRQFNVPGCRVHQLDVSLLIFSWRSLVKELKRFWVSVPF